MTGPRAVGTRIRYAELPEQVRAWVERELGSPVVTATGQSGGFSPGCAARLICADETRAFVKAVGTDLNPDTPALFRHELEVLPHLPDVDYRPRLIGTYDDGDWVGVLLEDVDGRHPDFTDPSETAVVWATVVRQCDELTPPPAGYVGRAMSHGIEKWKAAWASMVAEVRDDPGSSALAYLPEWAQRQADDLAGRVETLDRRLPSEALAHWDLRDDNLLVTSDGRVVIVDWGACRLAPHWMDLWVMSLEWAELPEFDRRIEWAVAEHGADPVACTDLLLGLGGLLAAQAPLPAPPGLPNLPEFRRIEAGRFLAAARRRLAAEGAI